MAFGDGTFGFGYAEDPAALAAEALERCDTCERVLTDENAATRTDPQTGAPDWTGSCVECAADPADDRDPRGPNPCICQERRDQCPYWEGPCPYAA